MITIDDLKAAIAECEGERNPNANTCMKLSAYYILLREKQGEQPSYSYTASPVKETIGYYSETEFAKAIEGKETASVLEIIDELMTVIQALQPRLYDGVVRKIKEI